MDVASSISPSQIVSKIFDTVSSCAIMFMETAARSSIGQTIFHYFDRFLWIVEKSAQWSLPTQEIAEEENGKTFGKMELVRPLPWIFFLPALIMLRFLRIGLNIGSVMLGYSGIQPAGMVKFLQKARRRLRNIKTNGMKNLRYQKSSAEVNDSNMNDAKWRSAELMRTIQMTLSSLSCLDGSKLSPSPPPTRIKVHINHESTPTPEEQSTTESAIIHTKEESKRKYSDMSSDGHSSEDDSEEETVQAKIDRLAAANDSTNDDEYNPGDLSSLENDSQSISGESNISETEIQELQDEANLLLHRALVRVTEVINEEPEPIKSISVDESTGEDNEFVNTNHDYTSGNRDDFYSPCKLSEDGETAFYSPISSTSTSPDRMVTDFKQGQQDWPIEHTTETTNVCQNGEQSAKVEPQISGSADNTTNGHADEKHGIPAKASSKTAKYHHHHRGKRTNHPSRKKK